MADRASDNQGWRYERKFHVDALSLARAECLVRMHPALFRRLYVPRFVNNVYFDGFGERAYHDNTEGVANRVKIRIRWYGELMGEHEPTLELKIKRGLVGRKVTFPLPPLTVRPGITGREITQYVRHAELPELARRVLQSVDPVLINRYRRRYYRTSDGRFRLTLDDAQEFWGFKRGVVSFAARWEERHAKVFELKYELEHDEEARRISGWFPFRVTRSSKYVTGLQLVRS